MNNIRIKLSILLILALYSFGTLAAFIATRQAFNTIIVEIFLANNEKTKIVESTLYNNSITDKILVSRISSDPREIYLKNRNNLKFQRGKSYTSSLKIYIPHEIRKKIDNIKISIGDNIYNIAGNRLNDFFSPAETKEYLVLTTLPVFDKTSSIIPHFNRAITWKGDLAVLIQAFIHYLWIIFFISLIGCLWMAHKNMEFYRKVILATTRIENFCSLRRIKYFSLMAWIVLLSITTYSFFFNFDMQDEGYFNYLSQQGLNGSPSLSFFYLFTHHIGALFNHKLIFYRLINFIFLVLTGIYFIFSIKIFKLQSKTDTDSLIIMLSFNGIATLNYFVYSPTPDYNSFAVISAGGWAASVLQFLSSLKDRNNKRYFWVLLIGVFIFLAISSRFTFGIPLYVFTVFLFIIFKYSYSIRISLDLCLLSIWMLIMSMAVYFYLTPESIEEIKGWFSYYSSANRFNNSQSSDFIILISIYLKQINKFFYNQVSFFILFLVSYLFLKKIIIKTSGENPNEKNEMLFSVLKNAILICFLVFIIDRNSKLILTQNFHHYIGWTYSQEIYAALIVLVIYYMIKLHNNKYKKNRLVIFLVVVIGLMHPAGTGVNFFNVSSYALFLPAGLFICLYYTETGGFRRDKLTLFLIILISTVQIGFNVLYEQIIFTKRNGPYTEQTDYSMFSPYLYGIKIEKDMAEHIDHLYLLLNKTGFDFERDRIFAFADVPGLLSATGAKAFGEPWIFVENNLTAGYVQSWSRACSAINLCNKKNIRHVYILNTNYYPMPDEIVSCLDEKITPVTDGKFSVHKLGKGIYHWFNKEVVYNITLEGPYTLISR